MFARAMRERGGPGVVAVAHEGETDPTLAQLVEEIRWVRLGQFRKVLGHLQRGGARGVVLVGGIRKQGIWRARPDRLALRMVLRLWGLHDDQLLRAAGDLLEAHGFSLRSVTDYLPELLAPRGCLTRRQPTPGEWEDIRFGWRAAKALGSRTPSRTISPGPRLRTM
ncbi:MAG: DUF1009 domain-containing protein, partial [Magnetococcales bacterium]|nr:DUF1009 domain-containing protein [Magnetococcales bacterium]